MWGVQAMTVSSLNSSAFSYFRSQCTTVQNKYSSIWWCKHRKKMSDHVPGHSGGVSGVRPGDTALLVLIWSLVSSCHWSYSLTDNWVQTLIIRLIYFEGKCTSLHTVFTCFIITLAFTAREFMIMMKPCCNCNQSFMYLITVHCHHLPLFAPLFLRSKNN